MEYITLRLDSTNEVEQWHYVEVKNRSERHKYGLLDFYLIRPA